MSGGSGKGMIEIIIMIVVVTTTLYWEGKNKKRKQLLLPSWRNVSVRENFEVKVSWIHVTQLLLLTHMKNVMCLRPHVGVKTDVPRDVYDVIRYRSSFGSNWNLNHFHAFYIK